MDKSDQHKKLVETSGERKIDLLIGADPEGGGQKRDPQKFPLYHASVACQFSLGCIEGQKKKL